MFYELKIDEKDRVAGRFISSVKKKLFMAAFDEAGKKKTTQQAIATKLGVNRSVINRMLRNGNITLRSVGEIAWALGKTPRFTLDDELGVNRIGSNWVRESGSAGSNILKQASNPKPTQTDPAQISNAPI